MYIDMQGNCAAPTVVHTHYSGCKHIIGNIYDTERAYVKWS